MKINWGTSLALVMAAFMLFILSFVYYTFTNKNADHHLVSKEYYKDELNYQQEIDALANAKKLSSDIRLETTEKGVRIIFPSDVDFKDIKGTVNFQRASNPDLDLNIPIELSNHEFLIADNKLVKGFYNVKIKWAANNVNYQYRYEYTY